MHQEARARRAMRCLSGLMKVLAQNLTPRLKEGLRVLQHWDGHVEPDRVGATIFEIFFANWTKTVVREHFEGDTAALLSGGAVSLAALLLTEDRAGWFAPGRRETAIRETMNASLAWLTER